MINWPDNPILNEVYSAGGKSWRWNGSAWEVKSLSAEDLSAIPSSQKGAANGVATLDNNAKLTSSQLPDLALTDYLGTATSSADMLTKVGQKGDWVIRTDDAKVYVITGNTPNDPVDGLNSWTALSYPLPPAQVQADWSETQTTEPDFIKNKPAIPTAATSDTADLPKALGTTATGTSDKFARADHVHPKPTLTDIGAAAQVTYSKINVLASGNGQELTAAPGTSRFIDCLPIDSISTGSYYNLRVPTASQQSNGDTLQISLISEEPTYPITLTVYAQISSSVDGPVNSTLATLRQGEVLTLLRPPTPASFNAGWIVVNPSQHTHRVFTPTTTTPGTPGFVPAPQDGDSTKFLKGDGTWATPPLATTSLDGLMSAADKTKLNGVAANANNYTHPNHTGDVTSTGDGETTITNNAVTNAKLAQVPSSTIKGRSTASTGNVEDLSAAQVRAILNVADGAQVNVKPDWNAASGSSSEILNKPTVTPFVRLFVDEIQVQQNNKQSPDTTIATFSSGSRFYISDYVTWLKTAQTNNGTTSANTAPTTRLFFCDASLVTWIDDATIGTDGYITKANHGFANGSAVNFTNLVGGAGLTANRSTAYYVINSEQNRFQVASTSASSTPVAITTAYSAASVYRDSLDRVLMSAWPTLNPASSMSNTFELRRSSGTSTESTLVTSEAITAAPANIKLFLRNTALGTRFADYKACFIVQGFFVPNGSVTPSITLATGVVLQ